LLVFINPFFSSGVHLVFTGEIVATVFITSSICGPVANTLRLMSASITIPRLVLHIQGTSYSYLSSFCGLPEHFSDSLSPSWVHTRKCVPRVIQFSLILTRTTSTRVFNLFRPGGWISNCKTACHKLTVPFCHSGRCGCTVSIHTEYVLHPALTVYSIFWSRFYPANDIISTSWHNLQGEYC